MLVRNQTRDVMNTNMYLKASSLKNSPVPIISGISNSIPFPSMCGYSKTTNRKTTPVIIAFSMSRIFSSRLPIAYPAAAPIKGINTVESNIVFSIV